MDYLILFIFKMKLYLNDIPSFIIIKKINIFTIKTTIKILLLYNYCYYLQLFIFILFL